jgi:broad specificity phosphatase PhoE|tara:strand:+ start:919 stop:1563 length:645 start_codon:yes stop_codon:yes gene_type:complete
MSRLLFVRHGKQQSTSERSELDRKDPPLSELGTQQALARAEQLADELGGVAPLLIASSPMRRALMTAAPIAAALKTALLVNGACYEYSCAGAEFRGSGMGAIRAISADASLLAVGPNGEWEYQGSDAEESDLEARQRARRVAGWLRDDCLPQVRGGGAVVLVAHQTFLDLVMQVLLTGSDARFTYGSPQHKLAHTGVCRLLAHPDGRLEKYQTS